MDVKVPIQDKKDFLREVLKNQVLKRRECVWILNYFISNVDLLERIHFVEEAHYCPLALVMSVKDSSGIPFRFYNGSIMTADAEKSFHKIRKSTDEEFYLQINFGSDYKKSIRHLGVLEDNGYIPSYLKNTTSLEDTKLANELISHLVESSSELALQKAIDKALDTGNKELFMKLTSKGIEY